MRRTSVNWKWALLNANHWIQWINWIVINCPLLPSPPSTPCRHDVVTKIRRPVSNNRPPAAIKSIATKTHHWHLNLIGTVSNGLLYFTWIFSLEKKSSFQWIEQRPNPMLLSFQITEQRDQRVNWKTVYTNGTKNSWANTVSTEKKNKQRRDEKNWHKHTQRYSGNDSGSDV